MQIGSSLTYYRDVMVYNGSILSYVLHPEGIIRKSNGVKTFYGMHGNQKGAEFMVTDEHLVKYILNNIKK